ncbi:MAG: NUDIX hydrolase [Pseudomonadota bacterium]
MSVWSPRTTVAAVISDGDRFLMVEEAPRQGTSLFNQPAGHLEDGETLVEAAHREVREETAWGFVPLGLVGVYKWRVPAANLTYVRYCFHGTPGRHDAHQPLDGDIMATHWMTAAEILGLRQRHRSPMVVHCLNDFIAGRSYPLELINEIESP